ncbi:MAG: hypothetical protein LBB14_02200 [Puniceicoccales bacterium]|nr:hypothetical protein [Puniceicoccales bacterium]
MLNGVARSVGQANKPVFGPNAPVLVGDPLDLLCEYLLKPIPRGTEVSYDGKSFSANSWPDLFSQIIQFQIRNFKKPLLSVAFRSGDFGRDDGTKIKESLRKISHGGLASIVEPNNPLIANGSVWFRLFEKLWIMEQIERLNAIIESYTRIKNNVSALQKIMDEARILLKDFSSIASQGSMPKYLREVNWNVETSGENFLRKGEICAAHKEFDASLQNEINEFMAEKADLERLLRLPIPLQDQSIMLFGVCFVCWVEEKHRETGIREK